MSRERGRRWRRRRRRRREDQSWWIMEGVGRSKFDGDTVRRLKETIFTAAIIRTSDLIRAFVSFCFYYYR